MSAMFVTRTGHINHKNNGLFPANQTAKSSSRIMSKAALFVKLVKLF